MAKNFRWSDASDLLLISYVKPLYITSFMSESDLFRDVLKNAALDNNFLHYNAETHYQTVNKHFKSLKNEYYDTKSIIDPILKQYKDQFPRPIQPQGTDAALADSLTSYDAMFRTFRDATINKYYSKSKELYAALTDLFTNKMIGEATKQASLNLLGPNYLNMGSNEFSEIDMESMRKKSKSNNDATQIEDIKNLVSDLVTTSTNLISKVNYVLPAYSLTPSYPTECTDIQEWARAVFPENSNNILKVFKQHDITVASLNNGLMQATIDSLGLSLGMAARLTNATKCLKSRQ